MITGRLPFQCGGNFPRVVYFNGVVSKDALITFAEDIHAFTTASIEHVETLEMFDVDLREKEGGPYHSVKFLLIVHMRDKDGVIHSIAIPAPDADILEVKRQLWALKDEPGQLITQAYSRLTGLAELTFDQGALVG